MSDIQKCPNLVRGGGVNISQKYLKFKNVPKVGGGGGVNPNWDIVPNFLDFLFWRLPLQFEPLKNNIGVHNIFIHNS